MTKDITKQINKAMIDIMSNDEKFVGFQIKELKNKLIRVKAVNKLIAKDKEYSSNPIYTNGVTMMKASESMVESAVRELTNRLTQMKDMKLGVIKLMNAKVIKPKPSGKAFKDHVN